MDAFEYNAWATRQLGDVCSRLPAEQLTEKEDWQYQPILELCRTSTRSSAPTFD
jgi:uncharacterized damage-inducible protein DinB